MTRCATFRVLALLAALALGIAVGCTPPPNPVTPTPVELRSISVDEYEGEIAKHKGKVVLVDVWFKGCPPCLKKFPEFVALHRELGPEGLICISLDVNPQELERKDEVLGFLRSKGADTINLIFDDRDSKLAEWFDKYDCHYTPAAIAYDRRGERVRVPVPADKGIMTKFLKELLASK